MFPRDTCLAKNCPARYSKTSTRRFPFAAREAGDLRTGKRVGYTRKSLGNRSKRGRMHPGSIIPSQISRGYISSGFHGGTLSRHPFLPRQTLFLGIVRESNVFGSCVLDTFPSWLQFFPDLPRAFVPRVSRANGSCSPGISRSRCHDCEDRSVSPVSSRDNRKPLSKSRGSVSSSGASAGSAAGKQ